MTALSVLLSITFFAIGLTIGLLIGLTAQADPSQQPAAPGRLHHFERRRRH